MLLQIINTGEINHAESISYPVGCHYSYLYGCGDFDGVSISFFGFVIAAEDSTKPDTASLNKLRDGPFNAKCKAF